MGRYQSRGKRGYASPETRGVVPETPAEQRSRAVIGGSQRAAQTVVKSLSLGGRDVCLLAVTLHEPKEGLGRSYRRPCFGSNVESMTPFGEQLMEDGTFLDHRTYSSTRKMVADWSPETKLSAAES